MRKQKNGDYADFCTWLDWVLSSKGIEQALAFNFNIYEDSNNHWSLELVGTSQFSAIDSDWACEELFATHSHPFGITHSGSWQEVTQVREQVILNSCLNQGQILTQKINWGQRRCLKQ